jgi:hypothetical protein
MLSCTLCEKETCYVSKFCTKCRRIKHLINLYGEDVYTTLETVLVRNQKQQTHKINTTFKKSVQNKTTDTKEDTKIWSSDKTTSNKQYNLRNSIKK